MGGEGELTGTGGVIAGQEGVMEYGGITMVV